MHCTGRSVIAAGGALFLTACTLARWEGRRGGQRRRTRTVARRPAPQPFLPPPVVTPVPPRDVAARSPVGEAPIGVAPIAVVPRSAWGAEPLKDNHDPMARVRRITLHHTAELPSMASLTDRQLMKAIQNFHRNERGWADIGYHYVIGRDGTVFEGRALNVQGAHAGGDNNIENLGISAIGDFSHEMPPTDQLAAIEAFLRAQQARYGVAADQVFGHRDFKPTECPGTPLYAWLTRHIKRQAIRAEGPRRG